MEPLFNKTRQLKRSEYDKPLLLIEQNRIEVSEKLAIPPSKFLNQPYNLDPSILFVSYIDQLLCYLILPFSTEELKLSNAQIDCLRTESYRIIQDLQQDPAGSALIQLLLKCQYNSLYTPFILNKEQNTESIGNIKAYLSDILVNGLFVEDNVKKTIENQAPLTSFLLENSEGVPFIRNLIVDNTSTPAKAKAFETKIYNNIVSGSFGLVVGLATQGSLPMVLLTTSFVSLAGPKFVSTVKEKEAQQRPDYTKNTSDFLEWPKNVLIKIVSGTNDILGVQVGPLKILSERLSSPLQPADQLTHEQIVQQLIQFYDLLADPTLTNQDFNSNHEQFVEINKKNSADQIALSWESPLDSQFEYELNPDLVLKEYNQAKKTTTSIDFNKRFFKLF